MEQRLKRHLLTLDKPRNPYDHPTAHQAARIYLQQTLLAQGRRVEAQDFCTDSWGTGVNLIGHPKTGLAPTHWLIAHYDTVSSSPGADDNGSAVAVALEVGAACPALAVVLTDLEEVGLLGARHFVLSAAYSSIPAIVLESVGFFSDQPQSQSYPPILPQAFPSIYETLAKQDFRGNFLALLHLLSDEANALNLEAALALPILRVGLPLETLQGPAASQLRDFGRSDHLAFWEQGLPCLMLTDSANFRNPNYHQPGDCAEHLDFFRMAKLVQSLITALYCA